MNALQVTLMGIALTVAGCASSASIHPTTSEAKSLDEAFVDGKLQAMNNGLKLKVFQRSKLLHGNTAAIPLRVRVRNLSNKPVEIRYKAFRLTSDDNTIYRAVPPLTVKGLASSRPASAPSHAGFFVAPYYGAQRTAINPYSYKVSTHHRDYSYWRSSVPSAQWINDALPEGVLNPGGVIDGFLYFERVGTGSVSDSDRATLRATLRSAESKQPVAVLQAPVALN